MTYEKEREQRKASELERVQQTLGEERQEWERKYKIADKNFKETSQQLSLVNETAMVQKLKLDEMTSKQN